MRPYVFVLIFFGIFYIIEIVTVIRVLIKNPSPIRRIKITLTINIVIFFSGVLMLAIALLFDINYLRYESPIPYSEWKKISFNDFRGFKRPNQTLDGQQDFAFIVSEFNACRVNDNIIIATYFHPSRSYVFNTDLEDEKLLSHEIYHFHITEYSARLFRQEIKKASKPISDNTLEAMEEKFQIFQDSLQFQYDDQTYHSYLFGKQKSWQSSIDSCLKSLKEYENPIINNN